jgi:hypothetical protein
MEPAADQIFDEGEGKTADQGAVPAIEVVEFRSDVRTGEHGAQAGQFLFAVRPPSAQVRDRVVGHGRHGEVGRSGMQVR